MLGLSERGRTYALFTIVVLITACGALSQTCMNAMLSGVEADFGVDANVGQWLTTSYMLMLGITVPSVTYLSKRFSIFQLVMAALALFFAASVIARLAPCFPVLLCSRILQAIATGITMPLLQTIAMTRFPDNLHGTAMGISGIALGFAPNLGPFVGGMLVDSLGWRSFYVFLIGYALVLFAATLLLVERDPAPAVAAHLNVVSLALSTLGFGGLLLGFTNASSMSVASPFVWGPVVVGGVCLAWFVLHQKRSAHPLIDMRIFSSWRYRASYVAQNCLFASFMGITLVVPLYVEGLCGGTALAAGMVFLPNTVCALFVNPLAGALSDKLGARRVVLVASSLLFVGALAMTTMDAATPIWAVALLQMVRGLGVSALIGPLNSWGMKGLPREITMDGSAFFVASRQASAALGTAIMVLIITVVSATALPAALAYQLAFGFSACCALVVLVTAAWKVRG